MNDRTTLLVGSTG